LVSQTLNVEFGNRLLARAGTVAIIVTIAYMQLYIICSILQFHKICTRRPAFSSYFILQSLVEVFCDATKRFVAFHWVALLRLLRRCLAATGSLGCGRFALVIVDMRKADGRKKWCQFPQLS
jgi:hypothetical protein